MRIVIADDDPVSLFMTQHTLERAGYEVIAELDGYPAFEHLSRDGGPRLALLDWMMPGLDGPSVCRAIRALTDHPYIYIILLTSNESTADLVAGLAAGADDYLTKPCDAEELKARLRTGQRILNLQDKLVHDARHDSLTQLPNRTYFLDRLNQCVNRSQEDPGYEFAVLFMDLDRFKAVNDGLGHPAGDELLKQVAERLLKTIRPQTLADTPHEDLVARLGGDEFTVLLDGVRDAADATEVANRIQRELLLPFPILGQSVRIGASIGISLSSAGHNGVEEILRDADRAMYRSKAMGRRVVSEETRSLFRHLNALSRADNEVSAIDTSKTRDQRDSVAKVA
jgi:diguanylate cyclase (GGDEF)-like protein